MYVISASSVDHALWQGLTLLTRQGVRQGSRAGEVLVMDAPVMTINENPMNRVSFDSRRDANPFFHLMEAFWMLAGRNDATWLDQFVADFSQRYAEPDGRMHAAYGFRWRKHFELEGGGGSPDQLETVVSLLRNNHDDRRVVITMWDPLADLAASKKDVACNTHIYLRIREIDKFVDGVEYNTIGDNRRDVLDLTVCCRSNDAIWGCHGSNAVHFSILQEYLAARIGVGVGKLYQMSNNYHAYVEPMSRVWPMSLLDGDYGFGGPSPTPIATKPDYFNTDLERFFSDGWKNCLYDNQFFFEIATPLRYSYELWRNGNFNEAREIVRRMRPCDWSIAAADWYLRKVNKRLEKSNVG